MGPRKNYFAIIAANPGNHDDEVGMEMKIVIKSDHLVNDTAQTSPNSLGFVTVKKKFSTVAMNRIITGLIACQRVIIMSTRAK